MLAAQGRATIDLFEASVKIMHVRTLKFDEQKILILLSEKRILTKNSGTIRLSMYFYG